MYTRSITVWEVRKRGRLIALTDDRLTALAYEQQGYDVHQFWKRG